MEGECSGSLLLITAAFTTASVAHHHMLLPVPCPATTLP
jgi:hypothetical protein